MKCLLLIFLERLILTMPQRSGKRQACQRSVSEESTRRNWQNRSSRKTRLTWSSWDAPSLPILNSAIRRGRARQRTLITVSDVTRDVMTDSKTRIPHASRVSETRRWDGKKNVKLYLPQSRRPCWLQAAESAGWKRQLS